MGLLSHLCQATGVDCVCWMRMKGLNRFEEEDMGLLESLR